jgi:hypothetical protein
MALKKLHKQTLALERDALFDALVTTTTQMAAAEALGISPSGIGVVILRHPGIKEEVAEAKRKATASLVRGK